MDAQSLYVEGAKRALERAETLLLLGLASSLVFVALTFAQVVEAT